MDDVILFGTSTFEDWIAFKVILDTFCEASGMLINMDKYSFLHSDLDPAILISITNILPFRSAHIDLGFSYLGFQLKPSGYLVKDWIWLLR